MENKYCKKCNKELNLINFHKDKSKQDGYSFYCKECWSLYKKDWRIKTNRVKKREIKSSSNKSQKVNKEVNFYVSEIDRNVERLITFYKRIQRRNGICSLEDILCEMLDLSIYFFGQYNYCSMKSNKQLELMWKDLKEEAEKRLMIC